MFCPSSNTTLNTSPTSCSIRLTAMQGSQSGYEAQRSALSYPLNTLRTLQCSKVRMPEVLRGTVQLSPLPGWETAVGHSAAISAGISSPTDSSSACCVTRSCGAFLTVPPGTQSLQAVGTQQDVGLPLQRFAKGMAALRYHIIEDTAG